MLSSGGSDWRTIHLKRIDQETGEATGGDCCAATHQQRGP